jgi:hypothetical protein
LKRASPEAIALMMRNLKANSGKKKAWVPAGLHQSKDGKPTTKALFF